MLSRIINRLVLYLPSNPRKVFRRIYKKNVWGSKESVSGPGSTLSYTADLRDKLPGLLKSLGIKKMIDAPCGDCNWISHVDLSGIDYTGIDIVTEIIELNKKKYPGKKFMVGNIIAEQLPAADLLLCRDCFIHLRNDDVVEAIQNFKRSEIKYLLASTYPVRFNKQILTGHFRPVNLELPPFNFPPPLQKINDYVTGQPERYLALWMLDGIVI